MPLTYREIADQYSDAKQDSPFFESMSLPDYADYLNKSSGTNAFDAAKTRGLGGLIKKADLGLTRTLEPVSKPVGEFFGKVGDVFGEREPFQKAGEGLLKGTLEFAPLIAAELFSGGAATPATLPIAAGLLGSAALTGGSAYAESGSPAVGLLTGASTALIPGFAGAGARIATRLSGVTEGLASRLVQYLGAQAGIQTDFELAGELSSKLSGAGFYNPLQPEHVIQNVVSQLPFILAGLPKALKEEPLVQAAKQNIEQAQKGRLADSVEERPLQITQPGEAGFVAKRSDTLFGETAEERKTRFLQERKVKTSADQTNEDQAGKTENAEGQETKEGVLESGAKAPVSESNLALSEQNQKAPVETIDHLKTKIYTADEIGQKVGLAPITDAKLQEEVTRQVAAGDTPDEAVKKVVNRKASATKRRVQLIDQMSKEYNISTQEATELFEKLTPEMIDELSKPIETQKQKTIGPRKRWTEPDDYAATLVKATELRKQYPEKQFIVEETKKGSGEHVVAEVQRAREVQESAANYKKVTKELPEPEDLAEWLAQEVAKERAEEDLGREFLGAQGESGRIKAGGNFLFSLGGWNPAARTLGKIKGVPKTGLLSEKTLAQAGGSGKPISQAEIELYKQLVPEAFHNGLVDVQKLVTGLKEKGPVIETRVLGTEQKDSSIQTQARAYQHQLETAGYGLEDDDYSVIINGPDGRSVGDFDKLPEPLRVAANFIVENSEALRDDWEASQTGTSSRWGMIGPKPESEMSGYVEGLVRVPSDAGTPQRERNTVKYTGPHFGSEDRNVLSFYRGYEETLPDGTKAFHVIEVQSDWGQSIRNKENAVLGDTRRGFDVTKQENHPLLEAYEQLALKAAIAHAKEIGATKVILSDAETAMMTEGHDRVHVPHEGQFGYGEKEAIPQSAGMRLHYDQTLPKELEKLTGVKGKEVELGEHKAIDDRSFKVGERGSPIFKDPTGQPKTQITGRMYDISNVPGEVSLVGARGERGRVIGPAIVGPKGEVLAQGTVGQTHAQLLDEAMKGPNGDKVLDVFTNDKSHVFVDDKGQVIDRNAAGKLADQTGQRESSFAGEPLQSQQLINTEGKPSLPSTTETLRQVFETAGIHPDSIEGHVEGGLKVTSLMPLFDNLKVGELVPDIPTPVVGITTLPHDDPRASASIFLRQLLPEGKLKKEDIPYAQKFILGHELTHQFIDAVQSGKLGVKETKALNGLVDLFDGDITPAEARQVHEAFLELAGKKDRRNPLVQKLIDTAVTQLENARTPEERQHAVEENISHVASVMSNYLAEGRPKGYGEFLSLMPKPIADFLTTVGNYIKSVMQGVKATFHLGDLGFGDKVTDQQRKLVQENLKNWEDISRSKETVDSMVKDFLKLETVDPQGFREATIRAHQDPIYVSQLDFEGSPYVKRAQADMAKAMGLWDWSKEKLGKGLEKVAYGFEQLNQKAERKRQFRDILYTTQNSQRWASEMRNLFGFWLSGHVDEGQLKNAKDSSIEHLFKVIQEPYGKDGQMGPLKTAYSKIALAQQAKEDPKTGAIKPLELNDPEFQEAIKGLSQADKDRIIKFHDGVVFQQSQITDKWFAQNGIEDNVQRRSIATALMDQNKTLTSSQALELTNNLFDLVKQLKQPQMTPDGQILLQKLQGKLTPEQFDAFTKWATNATDKLEELHQWYKGRGGFVSEQRFGDHRVVLTKPDGTMVTGPGFDTQQRANQYLERKLKANPGWTGKLLERADKEATVQMSSRVESKLREFQNAHLEMAKGILGEDSETYKRIAPLFDMVSDIKQERAARSIIGRGSMRRLAEGREDLDMPRQIVHYSNALINSSMRRIVTADKEWRLADPELQADPQTAKEFGQSVENFLYPDSQWATKLRSMSLHWFLGLNPSSHIILLHDLLMTIAPQLTAEGTGLLGSYRGITKGLKNVTNWAITNKWDNPEHESLMREAELKGGIGFGSFDDHFNAEDANAINVKRLMQDSKELTPGQIALKPLSKIADLSSWLLSKSAHLNHRVALLASYDHFRDSGMSAEDATQNAIRFNDVANFHGGKAGRPLGVYSPGMRSAGQVITSLQNFVMGQVAMWARFVQHGYGSDVEGVNRSAARKAAFQLTATNLTAAGALGLPGVAAGIALLEKMFPNLQLHKELKEQLAKLGGDDQELGNFISDSALKGIASQLGVDVSQRLGLDNIMGTSPTDGWTLDNFIGPTGSIFHNMIKGMGDIATGHVGQGAEKFLPNSLKNLLKVYRNDFAVKDNDGNLLYQPSAAENFGQAIGFKPTRVARESDLELIQKRSHAIEARKTRDFHSQVAQLVREGRIDEAQNMLREKAQSDPGFDAHADVRGIADDLVKETLPTDPRRTGTRRTAQDDFELNRLFSLQGLPPSEVQRLQLRKQVEGILVPGAGVVSPSEFREAQLVDQLLSQDQNMPLAEAKKRVQETLRPVKKASPYETLERF